jgi:hypothetical protein
LRAQNSLICRYTEARTKRLAALAAGKNCRLDARGIPENIAVNG